MYAYSDFIRSSELNSRLGWLLMIGGLAYLFRYTILQKFLLGVLFLLVLSGSLDILYAVTFGGVFTSASFEAMAVTDTHEGMEFLFAYASFENVLLIAFYLIVSYLLLRRILFKAPVYTRQKVFAALGVVMLLVAIQQMNQRGRTFDTLPGFTGVAIDYASNHEGMDAVIAARQTLYKTKDFNAQMLSAKPQTYVIVVGEALNRNHMSLYGYPRDTTPNLNRLSSEFITFDNMVSAFAQTSPSLSVSLTQADTVNSLKEDESISLLGALKKAGFKTWWISNQQPLRRPTTAMAAIADVEHFISHDFHGVESHRYDGYLLPSVKEAIEDKATHKVIFVHLMGSHLQYTNRYPPEKSVFKGAEGVHAYDKNPSDSELDYINSYDDSVRYTDSVVSEMLTQLQGVKDIAALSFFADHGEEVFDSKDFKGHGPDGVTHNMLEIPFIFWRNKAYQTEFKAVDTLLKSRTHASMMLDDFFHFGLCTAQVTSDLLNPQRALCSPDYQAKPRIIYGKDYDKGMQ
jgi:heptose-I-phosphate ethanolaminephosphotransferase